MSESSPPIADAVRLEGISKIYRLYQKPGYRVLDLFGICPAGAPYYTEHAALSDVDLTIARGEKVAIIGRNGAGKSTLLKVITQTLRPTTGTVVVNGTVSALLQIGTGFHPDFTGRQNVYSGFAHLGITGRRADELFDEVVEFSELEEYIDQPMKSYSTGMGARLMFSASTVLVPDIFVIDELLGVGDAYFAHKSYERMRRLCSNNGTTLLLVTHDIYSALNVCDRFIWIDRGQVKMDDDGRSTVNAYENSIKEQEEERLRKRNASSLARESGTPTILNVRFASRNGFALPSPFAIEHVELRFEGGEKRTLESAVGAPEWAIFPEGNLGGPTIVEDRRCCTLDAHGSIYHKAEWNVASPPARLRELVVRCHYEGDAPVEVLVAAPEGVVLIRHVVDGAPGWREISIPFNATPAEETRARQGEYGTGLVRIRSLVFHDADGRSVTRCRHGDVLGVEVKFSALPALADRDLTFAMVFYREGVALGSYLYKDRMTLPEGDEFVLRATLDPVLFGSGQWLITVGFAEADIYKQEYNPFFSVNERWHHMVARGYELHVESGVSVDSNAFFVHPARLEIEAVETTAAPVDANTGATS